jgi:hypothetical protein
MKDRRSAYLDAVEADIQSRQGGGAQPAEAPAGGGGEVSEYVKMLKSLSPDELEQFIKRAAVRHGISEDLARDMITRSVER